MLYRSALSVCAVVFCAMTAYAQDPPPPPTPAGPLPPRTDRSVQGPEGILQTPLVRSEPWAFSLGVNGSYEGNALFTGPTEDDKEFAHTVQATLNRSWRLRRGDVSFSGTATQAFYQDTTSLNDFRYSVNGGLSHAITRRLTWAGAVGLASGLARDSQVLTDAGAVLPSTATTRSSTATSLFSYLLSPKASLTWSVAESGVGFSSAAFNGGANLTTAVSFMRQVGKRGMTVGVTSDYTRTFTDSFDSSVYGVLGTWTMPVGRGWMVSASGGVRPYSVPGEDSLRLTSTYNGGVTKAVRRNQTIGVTYSKSVQQVFGLREGNNLVQSVSGIYGAALGQKVAISMGGSFTQAEDPISDSSSLGEVVQGSLSYHVLRNLSLTVGTSVYSRKLDVVGRTNSTQTFIMLAYNTSF